MKRLLALLFLFPVVASGATLHTAEYGEAATFNFLLYNSDGTLDVDEVDGGAEVSIACDEGAETTATNDFVDEGTFYSISVTAAEMACARLAVVIAATDTNVFFVETYGHPSAQNPCGDYPCLSSGTATAATASTIVLGSGADLGSDDFAKGATISIVEGTGEGQTRVCSSYTTSTDTCTLSENWDTIPSTDSDWIMFRTRFATISVDSNGRVDVGSIGGTAQTANDVGADTDAILADTGTDGVAISASGADTIWDEVVETAGSTYTARCVLSSVLSTQAGVWATSGTTATFKDPGDNANRVVGTIGSASRSSITITCP